MGKCAWRLDDLWVIGLKARGMIVLGRTGWKFLSGATQWGPKAMAEKRSSTAAAGMLGEARPGGEAGARGASPAEALDSLGGKRTGGRRSRVGLRSYGAGLKGPSGEAK